MKNGTLEYCMWCEGFAVAIIGGYKTCKRHIKDAKKESVDYPFTPTESCKCGHPYCGYCA